MLTVVVKLVVKLIVTTLMYVLDKIWLHKASVK